MVSYSRTEIRECTRVLFNGQAVQKLPSFGAKSASMDAILDEKMVPWGDHSRSRHLDGLLGLGWRFPGRSLRRLSTCFGSHFWGQKSCFFAGPFFLHKNMFFCEMQLYHSESTGFNGRGRFWCLPEGAKVVKEGPDAGGKMAGCRNMENQEGAKK